jgi:tRNA (cmo5U34)-methyltransferase
VTKIWDPTTYNEARRRLVPCFDGFYGTVVDLVIRCCPSAPRVLDLGAGTGILSGAIIQRLPGTQLHLLDESAGMLERATTRLANFQPKILVQPLTAPLPPGPFDAVVSALAIHHLSDRDKQDLYTRILKTLAPGGLFLNAEQVTGWSPRLQRLFESTHLEGARALGSSEEELQGAVERMTYDQCATVADQLEWLGQSGFADVDCFFRWFRFAVFGGWKAL